MHVSLGKYFKPWPKRVQPLIAGITSNQLACVKNVETPCFGYLFAIYRLALIHSTVPPRVRYRERHRAIAYVVTQMEFEIGRIKLLAKSNRNNIPDRAVTLNCYVQKFNPTRFNKAGYASNEMIISGYLGS